MRLTFTTDAGQTVTLDVKPGDNVWLTRDDDRFPVGSLYVTDDAETIGLGRYTEAAGEWDFAETIPLDSGVDRYTDDDEGPTMPDEIPADWPVQPLHSGDPQASATCGHCELSWDDTRPTAYTPAPAARCPFETFHHYAA